MAEQNLTNVLEVQEEFFDLKEPLLISNNVEKIDDIEVSAAPGQNNLNGAVTIAMDITNTSDFILPADSGLKITGKFTKADGVTAIGAGDLELSNNWGWALFKNGWLEVGGAVVERIEDIRNATTLLGHCLKSKIHSQNYGELDTWIPDRGNSGNVVATNLGLAQRIALYKTGTVTTFEIYLRLRDIFGFCDVRKILYLIPLRLTLVRNDDEKILFLNNADPADASKVIITEMKWLIPKITPSAERKVAIQKLLSGTNFIPWTFLKRSTYNQAFAAGTGGTMIIKTTTANPRAFIIGAKDATANKTMTSDYKINNMIYDNVGITEIQVDLNSNFYPIKPLKLNFGTGQVADGYKAYSKFCLKNYNDTPLSLFEWININTVNVIDTSALPDNMKNNSILMKINISRDSTAPATTVFVVLLEDEMNKGFNVGDGAFKEWR